MNCFHCEETGNGTGTIGEDIEETGVTGFYTIELWPEWDDNPSLMDLSPQYKPDCYRFKCNCPLGLKHVPIDAVGIRNEGFLWDKGVWAWGAPDKGIEMSDVCPHLFVCLCAYENHRLIKTGWGPGVGMGRFNNLEKVWETFNLFNSAVLTNNGPYVKPPTMSDQFLELEKMLTRSIEYDFKVYTIAMPI